MLDLLELEIGFEEMECPSYCATSLEGPLWDGLDSWLGGEGWVAE